MSNDNIAQLRDWFLCSFQVFLWWCGVCVVCVRALLVMSKSLGSFVSPPAVQMKFQTFSACYRFSGLARIHGTFSRNCTAEFIWNKWNKGNFPVRSLSLLSRFLFYSLFSSINFSIIIRYLIVYLRLSSMFSPFVHFTLLLIPHFIP